jgi:ABC-2 type transport system ATP-binding protein
LLERVEEARDWLSARQGVSELGISNNRLSFGFNGDDDAQADLLDDLVRHGVRMRAFEEKRSSFEDLLVEVAENNRKS